MTVNRPPDMMRNGPLQAPPLSNEQWAAWRSLALSHALIMPILEKRLKMATSLLWVEYMILSALGRAREQRLAESIGDKGMRMTDLAVMAGVTNPAIRAAVNRLLGLRGTTQTNPAPIPGATAFVDQRRNPDDEKSWLIRLTPAGAELLAKADLEVSGFVRKFVIDSVSDADLVVMRQALTAICSRFGVGVDATLPAPRPPGSPSAVPRRNTLLGPYPEGDL